MTRVCVRHPFEHSDNLCGHCGLEFCRDCLVHPAGSRKHALCVPCALAASGVRSTAGRAPTLSKRELKKRVKERQEEEKALARLQRNVDPMPPIENPFTPGWAMSDDVPVVEELPISLPPPPPPPVEQVGPVVADERAPTLADLLPSMQPRAEPSVELAALPTREQQLGWDQQGEPEEPDRSRRGLLRRREPEPDDGRETSEMIAWLDEVFAPRE
jgi:hypothetical protein